MRHFTMLTAAAALTAVPAVAGAQTLPASQCAPAPGMGQPGFELLITVDGAPGTFRLTCRDGRLVAVPSAGSDSGSEAAKDQAAENETASAEGTADAKSTIDQSAGAAAAEIKQGADLSTTPNIASSDQSSSEQAGENATASADSASSGETAENSSGAEEAIDNSAKAAASEMKQGADLSETPSIPSSDQSSSQPMGENDTASADGEASGMSAADNSGTEETIQKSAKAAASEMKQGADLSETPNIPSGDQQSSQPTGEGTAASADSGASGMSAENSSGTEKAIDKSAKAAAAEMKQGADLSETPTITADQEETQPSSPADDAMIGTPALKATGTDTAGATGKDQSESAGAEASAPQMSDEDTSEASSVPSTTDMAAAPDDSAEASDMSSGGELPGADKKTDLATLGISPDATGSEAANAEAGSDASASSGSSSPDITTAMNAAGVSGQEPQASVTETERDDSAAGHTAMAKEVPSPSEMNKPGVSADEAAPDGSAQQGGEEKSKDRIASRETDQPDMVPVPLTVIGNAQLALPGVSFKSVSVQGGDKDRVYSLRGITRHGAEVSVDVEPTGHIRQVDREIAPDDVPDPIARIVDAVLPNADIAHVMLSSRDNYRSFFVFSGSDERGNPVVLEVRSDGRRVEFKKGV